MVQQINLLTPILLKPKRYFSALAMLQSLGLLLLVGLAFALWLSLQAKQANTEFVAAQARSVAEQQRLVQALALLPSAINAAQLQQRINQLDEDNLQLQQTLDALTRGVAPEGARHSDLLRLLAQSVPPSIWLSDLRWQTGRLELSGATLEPAAVQRWLKSLAQQPLLAALPLGTVKVEKWRGGNPVVAGIDAASPPAVLQVATPPALKAGMAVWSFRVVSELAAVAPAAAASTGARP